MRAAALVVFFSMRASAADEPLTCTASGDCEGALRCIEGRCVDPFVKQAGQTHVRGFVGLMLLSGPAFGGIIGTGGTWDTTVRPSGLVALTGGVLVGEHEVRLELSPFTYWHYPQPYGPTQAPTFQANVTYGYLLPVLKRHDFVVSWPFRVGGGFFAGNIGGDVYGQLRGDLIGVNVRTTHFMLDIVAPSFRFATTKANSVTPGLLSWEFGVGAAYVL
jgi:hypothetical protein